MKKIKISVLLTLVALTALTLWVRFAIWQMQNPGAPTWTALIAN